MGENTLYQELLKFTRCAVENLPEGGVELKFGEVTYIKVDDTYYQPIEMNGRKMHEVVEVKTS